MRTERSQIYKCKHCGQVVEILDGGMNPVCCGESMTLQPANTVEASREKHIPVIEVQDNGILVKIGSEPHPMTEEHLIEWVAIETEQGYQVKYLTANSDPVCSFSLADGDKFVKAYAYCNLHGLWTA